MSKPRAQTRFYWQNGFTYIEVIVALVIILIAAMGAAGMYSNLFRQEKTLNEDLEFKALADGIVNQFIANANLDYPSLGGMYFNCMNKDGSAEIANGTGYKGMLGTKIWGYSSSMLTFWANNCSATPICPANSIAIELMFDRVSGEQISSTMMMYLHRIDGNLRIVQTIKQEIPYSSDNTTNIPLNDYLGPQIQYWFGMSFLQKKQASCGHI